MSGREDSLDDTQLPTPASTPAPFPEEDDETHVNSQIEDHSDNSSNRGGMRGSFRGRGRGQGRSQINRGSSNHAEGSNFPNSEDLQLAFDNLKLEDREVSYQIEVDGRFSCTAQPQLASVGDQCDSVALIDTGASHHMFHDAGLFESATLMANHDPGAKLNLAGGGATLNIHSIGNVNLSNSKGEIIKLKDCLYVPDLLRNLIAGGRLLRAGAITTVLEDPNFRIDHGRKELFLGRFIGEGSMMYVALRSAAIPARNT